MSNIYKKMSTTESKTQIDQDRASALVLIRQKIKKSVLKKRFESFRKMKTGTWYREYSKLKREVDKKITEGKTLINEDLKAHFQQYVYDLANVEYDSEKNISKVQKELRDRMEKELRDRMEKELRDRMIGLLNDYSPEEISKVLEERDIDKTIQEASQISQDQLKKDEDYIYNNLNTDQGGGSDCMVHAWNAFLNFPFIQQLNWSEDEMESIGSEITEKPVSEQAQATASLMGNYCKWKKLIIPVLNDNKSLIDAAIQAHKNQMDDTVREWFENSLDNTICDDEWMQEYNLGTIQLLSIANLFHPNRPNEIILFTQITLQEFIDDDGTQFDSSYGAIPINTQINNGITHAICIKKNKNDKLFVVDSWPSGWKGVHPYEDYVMETKLRAVGNDIDLKVLVKINTETSIAGNTDLIDDNLRSLYSIEKIKKFKLCHTNKTETLTECPFKTEFKSNDCDDDENE